MGVTRCIKSCVAVIDGWIAVFVAWCVCSDTLSGVLGESNLKKKRQKKNTKKLDWLRSTTVM